MLVCEQLIGSVTKLVDKHYVRENKFGLFLKLEHIGSFFR